MALEPLLPRYRTMTFSIPAHAGERKCDASTEASRRISFVNRALLGVWRTGVAEMPSLSPSVIIAKAHAKVGDVSTGFPGGWKDRLIRLTSELAANAALTPLGRTIAHGQLVGAASTMLRMQKLWEQHPEIGEVPIVRPVVIAGQMRSGTTRLHRLLACDDRFRYTRFYESWTPLPSGGPHAILDDRRWRARAALGFAHLFDPGFRRRHPTHALAPDEEIGLFGPLMMPAAFEVQWRIPAFVRHCETIDTVPVYKLFRRMLQTIAWLRRTADDRPWILKVPQFSEDLASLLAVFPDARIIRTERRADDILASSVGLVRSQMALQSASVDCRWIESEWRRKLALRQARLASALARHSGPAITLEYERIDSDWRSALADLYRMLGMPFTEGAAARMAEYQSRRAPTARSAPAYRAGGAAISGEVPPCGAALEKN